MTHDQYEEAAQEYLDSLDHEEEEDTFDDDWRREMAMEAGMGLGIDAYNDMMGY